MDGEIGPRDKLFFFFSMEGEGKRLYLSFDCLFLTVCYLDLLSAECIRNVTTDEGIVDGGSERSMVAGHGGHKRE